MHSLFYKSTSMGKNRDWCLMSQARKSPPPPLTIMHVTWKQQGFSHLQCHPSPMSMHTYTVLGPSSLLGISNPHSAALAGLTWCYGSRNRDRPSLGFSEGYCLHPQRDLSMCTYTRVHVYWRSRSLSCTFNAHTYQYGSTLQMAKARSQAVL